jgi:transposase
VDDQRVISGIVHVLKSGGRWVDAPAVYGLRIPTYPDKHSDDIRTLIPEYPDKRRRLP